METITTVKLQFDELTKIMHLVDGYELTLSLYGAIILQKYLNEKLQPAKPEVLKPTIPEVLKPTIPEILEDAANTFRERNKVYGDNYKNVGKLMTAMFPNGVMLKTAEDFNKWHLFELMVVKMTRFANSGLMHEDSIHDLGVYSFMVQGEIKK